LILKVFIRGLIVALLLLVALVSLAIWNLTSQHPIELFAWTASKADASSSGALGSRIEIAVPGTAGDGFGTSLRLSGDALVVGAFLNDGGGADSGIAYVFRRKGAQWVLEAPLAPNNPDPKDRFGQQVAIDGDRIAVSSPHEAGSSNRVNGPVDNGRHGAGAVYVFERRNAKWQQTAYLKTSNTRNADDFGAALDLDGELVAVGVPKESAPGLMHPDQIQHSDPRSREPAQHSESATWAGAVHVFRNGPQGWLEEARLVPNEHESGLEFGSAVEVDADTIAVGCGATEYYRGGHVYVFRRVGEAWTQEAHLTLAPGLSGKDRFGRSLSLHGNVLAVGSPESGGAGMVFVYVRDGGQWRVRERIDGAALHIGEHFGSSLAMASDSLLVSSPGDAKAYLLGRTPSGFVLRGSAGTTAYNWAPISCDHGGHACAAMSDRGVAMLSVH
jgi:hypothetical protein